MAVMAPERKKAVSKIVRMRKQGKGLLAITKALNEQGVPTLGGAKEWRPPVVRSIIIRELGPEATKPEFRDNILASKNGKK